MANKYISPQKDKRSFTCPHCCTVAQMKFDQHTFQEDLHNTNHGALLFHNQLTIARCENCGNKIIWIDDQYVYPDIIAFEPNTDMPNAVINHCIMKLQ